MRLFTAIEIPSDIKGKLSMFLDSRRPLAAVHWSPVDNLHITTKFIGEWPEKRLGDMNTTLAAIPKSGPIEIHVRGPGWFPNQQRPRVFWAGVTANDSLRALAKATDHAVAQLGVPREERDFSPHLTLARVRQSSEMKAVDLEALRKSLENVSAEFGSFRAQSFFLYLSKSGKYTKLAEFPLK